MTILTDAWAARGWDVTLVLTLAHPGDAPFFEPNPRIRVQALDLAAPSRSILGAVGNNLRRVRALRRAIRESDPDVVLAFLTDNNVLSILASPGLGVPVVVEEHIYSAWPPLSWPWRFIRVLTYPFAASVVALTPAALATLGPAQGRHGSVIPNPVLPPPRLDAAPEQPPLVIALGRLVPQKGFDMLLAAFARVAAAHPDWRLEIWGEGPQRAALERQRASLGLEERVLLPGRTPDPYQVLRRASLFVMSSRREGFPTVLGEAMASGLPVLSFDCPSGPRDLIRDGVDGVLVPAGDVDALADWMERLVLDRALAERLAARAPEVLERFSLPSVLARWDALLSDVTGRDLRSAETRIETAAP
jgi:glycosyltransferase involved in cell wall biosynthesis